VTPAARGIAVVAGVCMALLVAAALVREAVLVAGTAVSWPAAAWWVRLSEAATWVTAVAAAVAATAAAAFILLALRQLEPRREGPQAVEFPAEGGWTRLDVGGLEAALRGRVDSRVAGLRTSHLGLTRRAEGWDARLEARFAGRDLVRAQREVHALLAADLAVLGGMSLRRLDLVVTQFEPGRVGA
jgi:hypothetical protein